jgi:hypothetical protein
MTLSEVRKLIRDLVISEMSDPKPGGRDKPTFRGTFFGQTVAGEEKEPTGQTIMLTDKDTGRKYPYRVKAKVTKFYWTWDGNEWMTEWDFKTKYDNSKVSRADFLKKKGNTRLR